jgi:DNA primase
VNDHIAPLSRVHREELERATAAYSSSVFDDDQAMEYLLVDRGLDYTTIADFRLGIVRDPINAEHERFRGMVCLPNLGDSLDHHPVGIKFRSLDPDAKPKYNQPAHQTARLFNLRAMSRAQEDIYITEGEFDAIALGVVGLPAVAVPGVSHWTKGRSFRARLFEGFRPILCRDSDEAAELLIGPMKKSLDDLVVRSFAPWKDVNEYLINEGPEALYVRATEGN